MEINSINPGGLQSAGQSRGTDNPVIRHSNVQAEPAKIAAVEKVDVTLSEDKRYESVKRAAQSFFKDAYVVSNKKFTIFKDSHGQFITRFTDLRDGSVTYYPEQDILARIEDSSQRETLIEIQA